MAELNPDEKLIVKDFESAIVNGNFNDTIRDMDNKRFRVNWDNVNMQLMQDKILMPFYIDGTESGAIKGVVKGSSTTFKIDGLGHVDKQINAQTHEQYVIGPGGKLSGLKPDAKLQNPNTPDDGQFILLRDNNRHVEQINRANHVNDEISYQQNGKINSIKRCYDGSTQSTLELDRNCPPDNPTYTLRDSRGIALGTAVTNVEVTENGLIKAKIGSTNVEWDVDGSYRKFDGSGHVAFMQDANGVQYSYEWNNDTRNPFMAQRNCPTKVTIQAPGHMPDIVLTRTNTSESSPSPTEGSTFSNQYAVTVGGFLPQTDSVPILVPVGHVSFLDLSIPIYANVDNLHVDPKGNLSYSFTKGPFYNQQTGNYVLRTDGSQDRNVNGSTAHTKPANASVAPGMPSM